MGKRPLHLILAGVALLPAIAAYGGWASITVEDLPDYVVARQPTTLTFTVRQHGVTLLGSLRPSIEATNGRLTATAAATPGTEPGQYIAALTVADTGVWTITIQSGFGNSHSTLMPIPAIAAGAAAPRPLAAGDRGRRLFVAKGCVTCHIHRDVNTTSVANAPDLTGRRFPPEYLTRFLANPSAVYAGVRSGSWEMPNLHLKPAEIASLVAFINTERQATGQ
jgi:cytochrome c553